MGYQALHIDAALRGRRQSLGEYKGFKNFIVEIQICTGLRHTLNEIEHKRKYKIGINLSDELNREINEISVMIDRADRDLDDYSKKSIKGCLKRLKSKK